jgi:hypothetical protein
LFYDHLLSLSAFLILPFAKSASEKPVLCLPASSRDGDDERDACQKQKSLGQMLKQLQHNNRVFLLCFIIPNLNRDLGFWFGEFEF